MAIITGMNKILVISAITLVAVVMVMSLVTPALAKDVSSHKTVLVFSSGCGTVPSGLTCVAADSDNDGNCEGKPFLIPTVVAAKFGIQPYHNCA